MSVRPWSYYVDSPTFLMNADSVSYKQVLHVHYELKTNDYHVRFLYLKQYFPTLYYSWRYLGDKNLPLDYSGFKDLWRKGSDAVYQQFEMATFSRRNLAYRRSVDRQFWLDQDFIRMLPSFGYGRLASNRFFTAKQGTVWQPVQVGHYLSITRPP